MLEYSYSIYVFDSKELGDKIVNLGEWESIRSLRSTYFMNMQ